MDNLNNKNTFGIIFKKKKKRMKNYVMIYACLVLEIMMIIQISKYYDKMKYDIV